MSQEQAGDIAPAAQQNFALAAAAALGTAIVGAVLWAIITVASERELGIVAIAVGALVGFAVRATGKSSDQKFAMLGAAGALIGCVLGNLLSAIAFFAQARSLGYGEVLQILDFDMVQKLMALTFDPMDLLFYGIAIYEGYRFSRVPSGAPAQQ